jgi:replicative DNA helicase
VSSKFNIERGLITKILSNRDATIVFEKKIKPEFFTGENRVAYRYILDIYKTTGEIPSIRSFLAKFPKYQLDKVGDEYGNEENLEFWCLELKNKIKHDSTVKTVEEVITNLEGFNTEEAFNLLKKHISFVEGEVHEQTSVDITKDTEDRVKAYLKRKETHGMQGLSWGIPHLDYMTKGIKKETLTTIVATTGVGKTFFEILIGAYCQLQNCRVLQFVTEMSEEIMRDRYEAMLFSFMYDGLSYNDFKSGCLDPETEEKYFHFLMNDLPRCEPLHICVASSVMGVAAEIEKHNPDLVLIDGVYLMEDDQGAKDDWLRVAHITRDLKKLAKRAKIPIIVNTQADKNTTKKVGPELGSIMYTQAIGQDSDDVIALYRDEAMVADRELAVKIIKQREGALGKVMMNWDFSNMNFSGIYAEGSTSEDVEDSDTEENLISIGAKNE